ncbi:MAG: hypothetical protein SPL80_10185 [Bacilli bacterium]|nr:hypothetical protein [Bacilli bacterium]
MAAKTVQAIRIAVTRGDCFEDNRPDGISNTGTYFISSLKDWSEFEPFFSPNAKYYFSSKKIWIYNNTFADVCAKFKDVYPDKFSSLKTYGTLFNIEGDYDPYCEVELRINKPRIFMRFKDNLDIYVKAFRHLLYSDLTVIVLEMTEKGIAIYPEPDLFSKGPTPPKKKLLTFEDLLVQD